jgi:hypothetical protein
MGIGLVFFYSRVQEGGGFAERLAACFVEDEGQADRIQRANATGIAWWGGEDGPLTDGGSVSAVLSSLNVRQYKDSETGTTVIIPFLRDDLRPGAVSSTGDDEAEEAQPAVGAPWNETDASYIRVALQRWYCARLDNRHFKPGARLDASVDGERLTFKSMLPVFQIAQGLYNRTLSPVPTPDALDHVAPGAEVHVDDVGPLRAVVEDTTNVGRVAMARLTREQLGMSTPHNNPSPFLAIYGRDIVAPFTPVVGFMRAHGMVVRWDDRGDARGWSKGVPAQADTYLLGVFVPDGNRVLQANLRRRLKHNQVRLEAYLRSCEMADHHQWSDPAGITVVSRMRERVADRLRAFVSPPDSADGGAVPLLAARTIADALLPAGFGSDGRNGAPIAARPPTEPRGASGGLPSLEVSRVQHTRGKVEFDWRLTWAGKPAPCVLRLAVDSEARPLTLTAWKKDAPGAFPLAIVNSHASSDGTSLRCDIEAVEDGSAVAVRPAAKLRGSRTPSTVAGTMTIRISPPPGGAIQAILAVAPLQSGGSTVR